MKNMVFGCVLVIGMAVSLPASAEVVPRFTSGSISFSGGVGMYNGTLTIAGPDDYYEQVTSSDGLPKFTLQDAGRLEDGVYSYSLTAATAEREPIRNAQNNGRGEAAADTAAISYSTSGVFRVKNGVIASPDEPGSAGTDQDQAE